MKKVIILGATGMAGHMISMYLKMTGEYKTLDICHNKKLDNNSILHDVKDINGLVKIIDDYKPDIIINCIGILNRINESKIADSICINAYFPKYLEHYYKDKNIKIIHLSTDCVFSGEHGNYNETSLPDGKDVYGRSKLLGEIDNNKDLTIRTSIIGPELKENGIGLFHWFMMQRGTIYGYINVIWNGVTTLELAVCIDKMIKKNLTGLYHLVPDKTISKFDLLMLLSEVFNKDIVILKKDDIINDKTLVDTRKLIDYQVPEYKAMIIELKQWIKFNKTLYKRYYDI